MKRPQLRCYPCRPFHLVKNGWSEDNLPTMFQGPFPAEEMGGEGGDEADEWLLCWFAALLAKTEIYFLNHPTQDPTRQLLKFDLSLVHRFRLRYSTTCDSYYRDWFDAIDPSSKGVIPGWDKAIYSVDNVRRHLNEDIGQVTHPLVEFIVETTGYPSWRFLSSDY